MTKTTLERMLNTEMDMHLGRIPSAADAEVSLPEDCDMPMAQTTTVGKRSPNRRNGRSRRTVQGDLGAVEINTPRDWDGTFEPLVVGKHPRFMERKP
jgi:putative transposase